MGIQDKWLTTRFKFGICDVEQNYRFYFKWLLSKMENVFVLKNVPKTIDISYLKEHLLLDGEICITKFNDELYAAIGSRGGKPNEYYRPTEFIIANPILGSKVVNIGEDGVVIYNTPTDREYMFGGGLFQLIKQTATLLADNIVSINCAQINTRVEAVFTADSEAQATAGELTLKKLYAGAPYNILRSDMIEKIGVNPIATAATSNKIRELVELHQYIIAQFFQAVGIKANAINKKERMITDEINSQDDYLGISLLDILESWKQGFNEVNEMYGTDIQVELNPILVERITAAIEENSGEIASETVSENQESEQVVEEEIQKTETESETEIESETASEPELNETASEEKQEEVIEETGVEEEINAIEEAADAIIDAAADTYEDETNETKEGDEE